jgi:hypothetical protein
MLNRSLNDQKNRTSAMDDEDIFDGLDPIEPEILVDTYESDEIDAEITLDEEIDFEKNLPCNEDIKTYYKTFAAASSYVRPVASRIHEPVVPHHKVYTDGTLAGCVDTQYFSPSKITTTMIDLHGNMSETITYRLGNVLKNFTNPMSVPVFVFVEHKYPYNFLFGLVPDPAHIDVIAFTMKLFGSSMTIYIVKGIMYKDYYFPMEQDGTVRLHVKPDGRVALE